ncbi:MAG: signal peptide peptidase SppA [Dongiaceae bacterium]
MSVIRFVGKFILWLCAVTGAFLIIGLIAGSLVMRHFVENPKPIPAHAELTLDLDKGVVEQASNLPFNFGGGTSILDIVHSLEAGAKDPNIDGLVMYLGRGGINIAQVQEIRDAVLAFRKSGKKVQAFAESFGEGGDGTLHYYLASAADTITLQPSGDLRLTGFHLETPFLKGAFDRLGITARMGQRKEFKGAVNTFTQTSMPEPQRQNMQQLADSWLNQVVANVASDRHLDPKAVRAAIDHAPLTAADGKAQGLVDVLAYRDAVDQPFRVDPDKDRRISISDYAKQVPKAPKSSPAIATIYGVGPVVLAASEADPFRGNRTMGADTLRDAIDDAIDDHVSAIVLRVDSPGGSYVAADTIWRAVSRARSANIPVIVSMSGLAASGGYFVAAPATKIVAEPGTITGSIGVFGGKVVVDGLLKNISVQFDGISAGAQADIDSALHDFSPDEWANLQHSLDVIYADFTGKVAAGRHLATDKTEAVAQGQIWTGADAKERGLVDALGGWSVAIDLAKQEAGIKGDEAVKLVTYPSEKDETTRFISQLFGRTTASMGLEMTALGQWATRFGLGDTLSGDSLQQRLPDVLMPPISVNGALR